MYPPSVALHTRADPRGEATGAAAVQVAPSGASRGPSWPSGLPASLATGRTLGPPRPVVKSFGRTARNFAWYPGRPVPNLCSASPEGDPCRPARSASPGGGSLPPAQGGSPSDTHQRGKDGGLATTGTFRSKTPPWWFILLLAFEGVLAERGEVAGAVRSRGRTTDGAAGGAHGAGRPRAEALI